MKTEKSLDRSGANKTDETAGTPEESSLTVKLLGEEWIVENGVGKSVGSARTREAAIEKAREVAAAEKASSIAVLGPDGALEKTVGI
jgi:hypothetical protein